MTNDAVPTGWKTVTLGSITQSAVDGPFGSNLKTEHYVETPGVRVIRLQNVGSGNFLDGDRAYISEAHARTLSRHDVVEGDLLVASLGDDAHPVARACQYPAGFAPAIVKADCFRLRFDNSSVNPGFIRWVLNCPSTRLGFAALAQGVTRDRVNLGSLARFSLALPPVEEQQTIADVLDNVDGLIRSTERLIAKLERVQRGMLNDLLRDSAIGRDGVDLGSCLDRIDAGNSPDLPDRPAGPGEWGVLKVSAVRSSGFDPGENKVFAHSTLIDRSVEVRDGDLLITRANTPQLVGLACYVRNPPERLLLCDKTLRLVVNEEKLVPQFAAYVLTSPSVRRQIEARGTGSSGSMKNITQNDIRTLLLALPDINVQRRIVEQMECADAAVDDYREELATLRMVNRGLTDDLLTGRVRVNVSP